ncbi:NAD(P)H-dependent oxidoreductase [Cellulomonas sp. RIT-PI-Y]|uniref:NAD(P)H-dependent oxidoreductase n=1 Tax=Cellulomonas sp. RIT-PI-Y TaxID=3035297 RepID=UPI0021DA5B3E|nr:NAD(P)H-dependent oxidoreductase [Cellulomonas sp. RIT-PI-Y]
MTIPSTLLTGGRQVVALTGNPRPGSRTAAAAQATAAYLGTALDLSPADPIDLSDLAPELLAPEHPRADRALTAAAHAAVLVVATPVHKASFTGLLKAFLDLYGPRGLAGVVAVPLVIPGDPAHALVGEHHLRPVLVELGAVLPTRSLVITAGQLTALDDHLDAWWSTEGPALRRAVPLEVTR